MNTASTQPQALQGMFETAREATAALAEDLQCRLDQVADAALAGIDGAEALSQGFQGKIAALRTNLVHITDKLRRHLGAESRDLLHTASKLNDPPAPVVARSSHPIR